MKPTDYGIITSFTCNESEIQLWKSQDGRFELTGYDGDDENLIVHPDSVFQSMSLLVLDLLCEISDLKEKLWLRTTEIGREGTK